MPNPKNKKLHSLETKNKIELEIDEKDPIFFCRKEKCLVRHALNLEKKIISAFIIRKETRRQ